MLAAAIAFLAVGAALPQEPIDRHTAESAEIMRPEGDYPRIADGAESAMMDNYTDAIILSQSKAMSSFRAAFVNPRYDMLEETSVESLYTYTHSEDVQPGESYARYWMGFRTVVRFCLMLLNYYQLRRYLAFLFFGMLMACVCSLAQHISSKAAWLFGISIALVRPYVIAVSLQYTCCFLIAMAAMLLVPKLAESREKYPVYFLVLGGLTMFFDFYTTPVLTFAAPALYLYLIRSRGGNRLTGRELVSCLAAWAVGYLGMWFAKMILTSLFTDVDGISNAIVSMVYRVGIRKQEGMASYYRPLSAVRAIWYALYADKDGEVILALGLLGTIIAAIVYMRKAGVQRQDLKKHGMVLVIAALPVVWLVAATQPTSIHYWFQYRGIAASFWGAGLYVLLTAEDAQKKSLPQ